MVKVLEFIDFVDGSTQPTERWRNYRGSTHRVVMAKAVREGYSELFHTYPTAYELDNDALEAFFSTKTDAGKQVVTRMARTFTELCELSDFDGDTTIDGARLTDLNTQPNDTALQQETKEVSQPATAIPSMPTAGLRPSLHIDVQIHISSDLSTEQIDQVFASMAKHLYTN